MPLLVKDRKLLKAYKNGESRAFEQVYNYYGPRLKHYLECGFTFESRGKICRFSGAASGMEFDWVVQETFVRVFEARTRKAYDGKRPFSRYLQTVARNVLLRELNRRRRLSTIEEDGPAADPSSLFSGAVRHKPADPERIAEQKEVLGILSEFMKALDEEEAEFVQLRFVQQLTQESTARRMRKTRARIKLLEGSLRGRFLDLFRGHGYFVERAPQPRWTRKEVAA